MWWFLFLLMCRTIQVVVSGEEVLFLAVNTLQTGITSLTLYSQVNLHMWVHSCALLESIALFGMGLLGSCGIAKLLALFAFSGLFALARTVFFVGLGGPVLLEALPRCVAVVSLLVYKITADGLVDTSLLVVDGPNVPLVCGSILLGAIGCGVGQYLQHGSGCFTSRPYQTNETVRPTVIGAAWNQVVPQPDLADAGAEHEPDYDDDAASLGVNSVSSLGSWLSQYTALMYWGNFNFFEAGPRRVRQQTTLSLWQLYMIQRLPSQAMLYIAQYCDETFPVDRLVERLNRWNRQAWERNHHFSRSPDRKHSIVHRDTGPLLIIKRILDRAFHLYR